MDLASSMRIDDRARRYYWRVYSFAYAQRAPEYVPRSDLFTDWFSTFTEYSLLRCTEVP